MVKLLEAVTKGGKLDVHPSVNDAKLMEADKILAGIRAGEHGAVTAFKGHLGCRFGEAIHTTGDDFIFAFAALSQLQVNNEWEAAERVWADIMETEKVSSFKAPKVYSINPVTEGFARPQTEAGKPDHIVPIVPEGSPYPHFSFEGEAVKSGGLHKAGGRYDLTFEKIIDDVVGLVPLIPKLILESVLEREEWDYVGGLVAFINVPANHLAAGTTIDGQTVPVDAPLNRASLIAAVEQAQNREVVPGRKVNVSSYTLLVPRGVELQANYYLNQINAGQFVVTDGSVAQTFTSSYNPLSKITKVVATDYLTGTQWALIPSKGAVRGSRKFYNAGKLVGHESVEIRLQNVAGQYLGGGTVAPFEGSFETDSAAFRGRIIGGGLGWNSQFAVFSDGDGA